MELTRLIVTKPDGTFVGDVDPSRIVDATFVQEVNGEHSLTIVTFDEYTKNDRLLWCDEMGVWHENVVEGTDGAHDTSGDTLHTYWCPWSLQHDLAATFVSAMPGTGGVPASATEALTAALSGTARWSVGTVTKTSTGSASMWRVSGWEALQTLVEVWGGELSVTLDVGQHGVVARYANLLEQVGSATATRRFDYGGDVVGITRTVSDQPWTCRVIPLGKAQQTDGGGYGRKTTIESVNGGVLWIQNDAVVSAVHVPSGSGWEYPTQIVENDDIDDPAQLKAWATDNIEEWTMPKVSYEVDVMQLAQAGVDATGVAEGDAVVVVDRDFSADGLAISGRALRIEGSLLDRKRVTLTLSNLGSTLGDQLASIARSVARLDEMQRQTSLYQATATYLSNLVSRLNGEINATGGYTYITEGEGIRTYDAAVSDPLVGAEASKVVEVKGGSIRIADSRTSGGDWDWKTVFVSGHILSDLVTTAKITSGYIGSADSGNFWDLDAGIFQISANAALGGRTVQDVLDDVDETITGVDVEYASNTSPTQAPTTGWSTTAPQWQAGHYIWSRTATTTPDGTSYSTPVMISGRDGTDGTNGVGISSTTVTYGVSTSAATQPSSWSSTAPTTIPQGRWLWTKTVYAYTDGSTSNPSYSKSYMGTDGSDGTSVTIKGSYDTYQQLIAAHPTGSSGDAYMVGTDLYVWNGTAWEDVGQIQGPQGPAGQNGTSVTVTNIQYGISNSASTQPSSWSTTAPTSIAEGKWLWVKTTYSDGSTATTKSYVGTDGADGTSVYITSTSKVGDTTTVHFSDGSTITVKDGEDGTNGVAGASGYVHTAWANSANGVTDFSTSVSANKKYLGVYTDHTAADSTNPSSYSWSLIKGADGTDGQNGLDGETAYVHTAWANSADGTTDFSTSVSAGKSYLGIYSDFIEADSTNPSSYKWSKIEGEQGTDGTGVTQIVEQYYLSTSSSTTSGGSWVTTPPTWSTGKYYWTRSQVTWTDGTTTYTTPVLSRGLNSANSTAKTAKDTADSASTAASNAAKVATDYLTFNSSTGLEMGYSGTNAKTRVNTSGLEVFDGNGNSALFAGLSGNKSLVRVGMESNSGNVVMSSDGYVDVRRGSTVMAHFGYGEGNNGIGTKSIAPYCDVGIRDPSTEVGNYSLVEGHNNEASAINSHAEGWNTKATGYQSHAEGSYTKATGTNSHAEGYRTEASTYYAHAEGNETKATGSYSHAECSFTVASGLGSHAEGGYTKAAGEFSHAEGYHTEARGDYSHAEGRYTRAVGEAEHACGRFNIGSSNYLISVGNGTPTSNANYMYLNTTGNLWIKGTLTQNSDRRLKEHHAYLSDDACDFIRKLRPALYTKDGERHTGFYAQDVQDAEPDGWDTATVTAQHTDEGLDFDPLTLDYQAIIAPLVAYCQHLEKRIEALEKEVK